MSSKADVEVWIALDCNGDYSVGTDREGTLEQYDSDHGGLEPRRVFSIRIQASMPLEYEAYVEVPDDAGEVVLPSQEEEQAA